MCNDNGQLYKPDAESIPNHTTEQRTLVNILLIVVTIIICPEKFLRDIVLALFLQLCVVIVTQPHTRCRRLLVGCYVCLRYPVVTPTIRSRFVSETLCFCCMKQFLQSLNFRRQDDTSCSFRNNCNSQHTDSFVYIIRQRLFFYRFGSFSYGGATCGCKCRKNVHHSIVNV